MAAADLSTVGRGSPRTTPTRPPSPDRSRRPEPFRTIVWVVLVLALIYEVLAAAGVVPSVWRTPPP